MVSMLEFLCTFIVKLSYAWIVIIWSIGVFDRFNGRTIAGNLVAATKVTDEPVLRGGRLTEGGPRRPSFSKSILYGE